MISNIPPLPLEQDIVKTYLPHRDPMLFIDRVVALSEESIRTETFISEEADFFKGHFPEMPVMPGVLIVEMVAQAGALLVTLSKGVDTGKFIAFTNVDEVRFRQPVYPNETIVVDVKFERVRHPFYKFSGIAKSGDKTVATLKFAAAQMEFNPNGLS